MRPTATIINLAEFKAERAKRRQEDPFAPWFQFWMSFWFGGLK